MLGSVQIAKQAIIAEMDARMAKYSQYKDHWADREWKLACASTQKEVLSAFIQPGDLFLVRMVQDSTTLEIVIDVSYLCHSLTENTVYTTAFLAKDAWWIRLLES